MKCLNKKVIDIKQQKIYEAKEKAYEEEMSSLTPEQKTERDRKAQNALMALGMIVSSINGPYVDIMKRGFKHG